MRTRALCFAALLFWARAASAQSDVDKAKVFFTTGGQAFERGDFVGAIQAFERANELAPRPAILFSIAQAYRRQYYIDKKPENLKAAVTSYRKYIEQAPDGNRRADAAQALAELGPAADRLSATDQASAPIKAATRVSIGSNAPNALIGMDGGPMTPAPFIHEVEPGEHTFAVSADGFISKSEKVKVVLGDFAAHEVQLKELPGKLTIHTSGQVLIDGRIVGNAPFSAPIDVEPGTRQIAVTANGHEPIVREVDIGRGESKSIDVALSSTGQRKIARLLLGVSAAGIVTGGVFVGVSLVNEHTAVDLRNKLDSQGLSAADAARYESARSDRNTWLVASMVAFGTAAAIGGTGLLLFLFDQPPLNLSSPRTEKKTEPKKPVEIGLSPTSVTIVGSF